jgi:hypothetical protein
LFSKWKAQNKLRLLSPYAKKPTRDCPIYLFLPLPSLDTGYSRTSKKAKAMKISLLPSPTLIEQKQNLPDKNQGAFH